MRLFVVAAAIAILAIMAITGIQASLETAGEKVVVENETFTPSAGSITILSDSQINGAFYNDTVDVYNNTGGVMDAGTDYQWFESNGTLKTLAGGDLDGEIEGKITYDYELTTKEQRSIAKVLGEIPMAMGTSLPVFLIIFFLIALRGLM